MRSPAIDELPALLNTERITSRIFEQAARSLHARCEALEGKQSSTHRPLANTYLQHCDMEASLPSPALTQPIMEPMYIKDYAICIIDGARIQLSPETLRAGGKETAAELLKQVTQIIYIEGIVRVVVYANVGSMGNAFVRDGHLADLEAWTSFVEAFNTYSQWVELIHVADSTARVDSVLRLHVADPTCKGIIYGGKVDSTTIRLAEPYDHIERNFLAFDVYTYPKPYDMPEANLTYCNPFSDIFRQEPLPLHHTSETPPGLNSPKSKPGEVKPDLPVSTPINRLPAHAAANPLRFDPLGNRLDERYTTNGTLINRITSLRCCNNHYLRGGCTYPGCKHRHNVELTQEELDTLRFLGRRLRCRNGRSCDDELCYAGHACPNLKCDASTCGFPRDWHLTGALLGRGSGWQLNEAEGVGKVVGDEGSSIGDGLRRTWMEMGRLDRRPQSGLDSNSSKRAKPSKKRDLEGRLKNEDGSQRDDQWKDWESVDICYSPRGGATQKRW